MSDWMEALKRHIVGVIGGLTCILSPVDQGMAKAVPHFLLLFIQDLLSHFLPHESEVAHGGHHPQADRFSGRQQELSFVAVVFVSSQEVLSRMVREIAGRKNVRNGGAGLARSAAAFCKVSLQKCAMAPAEFAKRVKSFDHACALRPAAACAGGKGNDRDLAVFDSA